MLFVSNIAYLVIPVFQSGFEINSYLYAPEIILLLINSLFVVLMLLLFYKQKKSTLIYENETELIQVENSNNTIAPFSYSDQLLIDTLPDILCIKDQYGRWLQANTEYLTLLDLQDTDYIGKTDAYLALNVNTNSLVFQQNVIQDKKAWQLRNRVKKTMSFVCEGGRMVEMEISTTPLFGENNQPFRLLISGQPLQQSLIAKTKLELLSSIFSSSHLSFMILDESLKITSTNSAFTSLFGFSSKEITSQLISHITTTKQKQDFCTTILAYFQKNNFQLWSGEVQCQKKNGRLILIKLEINPILSKENTFDNYFVTLEDITLFKENEKRILQIAHYDHLTGLVNRAMFMDRMAQFLSAAERHNLTAVIFFIDLDKFKIVNDTLGHDAGDDVLKETAKRLLGLVRKEDVVARFSGDEFAVLLLNEKTHEQAIFTSTMIAQKIIERLSEVFYINRSELFVGSSVGISIFPEDGKSSEQLLKHADMAMYEAKNQGRNNYKFYKKEFSDASKDRLAMENNLRKAIDNAEFKLFYQPQYDAKSLAISGAEVLIRWFQDPFGRNKMIPPDLFIPIAEETGLIIEIGAWVLETACCQFSQWLKLGYLMPQISVNVSARQFMDDGFMQSVEDALKKAELEPKYLELEITESMLIGDLNRIELQLKRLKNMGIKIALDDFGTGYSSLSYLKKFPIDVLKIDQSFIRELTIGSKDASIACAIIEMGHSLNQKIVAEGVENETQLRFLSERKCDFIQGYYFSKPLPVYKMSTLLQEAQLELKS
jgi:diguanylate cyclase (GGDEF)-like protein/PAS domain S-box-containing protein